MSSEGISVVVPVYNSRETLKDLVNRLESVLGSCDGTFEVILVNDGSKDNSWQVIEELANGHKLVKGLNLMRNYGQHNALLAGIRAARYATIVTIDDDLQQPPEEIPKLLGKLNDGCDVVYGTPQAKQHGFWRNLASQIVRLALTSVMNAKTARNVSAFRAFRTQLRDSFACYDGPFVSIDVLLTWSTKRFASVSVRHEQRSSGESNYTFLKLVSHALDMITGFSTLPLRLASFMGFLFSLFGFGLLIYVVTGYLIRGSIPGFPFLASIVAIFAGAQLFALGVIGEYLARIHFRTMGRPSYSIRSTAGKNDICEPKNTQSRESQDGC
ncbi:MAG: glycosyltransferase [Planctomycetota bacterium]|nr:MAG: glycosyltransferase [Planctomycetota bacterium]